MANVEFTSRKFYTEVANGNITPEVKEYAVTALAKLDEKNKKRRETDSAKQVANKALAVQIVESFEVGKTYTAKDIANKFDISTQKASALIRKAVETKEVSVVEGYKPEGSKSKVKGYYLTVKDTETV